MQDLLRFPQAKINAADAGTTDRNYFGVLSHSKGLLSLGKDVPDDLYQPPRYDGTELLICVVPRGASAKRDFKRLGRMASSDSRRAWRMLDKMLMSEEAELHLWPGSGPVFAFMAAELAMS